MQWNFRPFREINWLPKERRLISQRADAPRELPVLQDEFQKVADSVASSSEDFEQNLHVFEQAYDAREEEGMSLEEKKAIYENLLKLQGEAGTLPREKLKVLIELTRKVQEGVEQEKGVQSVLQSGASPNGTPVRKEETLQQNAPPKKESGSPQGKPTVLETTMGYAENVTEAILPEKWTSEMSDTAKRTVGIAVTAGGVLLAAWLVRKLWPRAKEAKEAGEETAKKTEGSWLKKLFWGLVIGTGVFFGGKYLLDKYKDEIGEMVKDGREKIQANWEAAMKKKDDAIQSLTNRLSGVNKEEKLWEAYGLSKEAHQQAESVFRSKPQDQWEVETRKIFGLGAEELQVIDAQRLVVRSRAGQVLSFIPNTIHTISDPVARTSRETIEFALNLLGQTGAGVWGGLKKIVNAFQQAA